MKKEPEKLDRGVADARRTRSEREQGYREKALKMYPWFCGRCMREFTHANVHELTVHHRDHKHDYNPVDGSNWEFLCVYSHDNEHSRLTDAAYSDNSSKQRSDRPSATHNPFAGLKDLLEKYRASALQVTRDAQRASCRICPAINWAWMRKRCCTEFHLKPPCREHGALRVTGREALQDPTLQRRPFNEPWIPSSDWYTPWPSPTAQRPCG